MTEARNLVHDGGHVSDILADPTVILVSFLSNPK